MKTYLDNFEKQDWADYFNQLLKAASAFYSESNALDHDEYTANIEVIKNKKLPISGIGFEGVVRDLDNHIVPGSIHQHNLGYMAFPDKGSSVVGQYAAIISSLINQNNIAEDKSSPTGTYIEMLVISWLRELIGFKSDNTFPANSLELGGTFVTGGVLANTIGLLAARQRAYPESKIHGMFSVTKRPVVFVAGSTMSHYSHFGASWWLGIGTDNVVEVDCDSKGNMQKIDLINKIESAIRADKKPVAIIALAGDSRTNTIDDLPGLYEIAQDYDIWLHADGCHAGILAFDDTFKHKNKHFLSYCDSISIDAHKHLSVPYSNSVVLFKNPDHLAAIGSSTDITIAYGGNDIGQVTPFIGSRPFDALKLYAVIQSLGVNGIKEQINKRKILAQQWYRLVSNSNVFIPMHEPELFALALSVKPGKLSPAELSERNMHLHNQLNLEGIIVPHMFNMRDYRNTLNYGSGVKVKAIGTTIGNDAYTYEYLIKILNGMENTYVSLYKD